jgi:hypothetical protein
VRSIQTGSLEIFKDFIDECPVQELHRNGFVRAAAKGALISRRNESADQFSHSLRKRRRAAHHLLGEPDEMVGIALFEAKEVHYLRNCVAGFTQFPEGDFHYSLSGSALNFFQEHGYLGNETLLGLQFVLIGCHHRNAVVRAQSRFRNWSHFRGESV